jgi:hypothetical protein
MTFVSSGLKKLGRVKFDPLNLSTRPDLIHPLLKLGLIRARSNP